MLFWPEEEPEALDERAGAVHSQTAHLSKLGVAIHVDGDKFCTVPREGEQTGEERVTFSCDEQAVATRFFLP